MKEELGTWGAVVGAAVLACLFGGLVLAIYPGWGVTYNTLFGPEFSWGTFWTAASAVGTFAAALAAIWVANSQRRQKLEDDTLRAHLVASTIAVRLSRFSTSLHGFDGGLGFSDLSSNYEELEQFESMQIWVARPYYKPSHEELAALISLPNRAAHRLARGYEYLEVLKERLANDGALERIFRTAVGTRKSILESLFNEFHEATKLIVVGANACVEASQIGAPTPSGEELYGEQ